MPERKKKQLYPTRIKRKLEIAAGIFTLETERKHDFIPGQVVAVSLSDNEEPRLYSIASGNNKDYTRILFDINPEGALTPRLAGLNPGEELLMSKPFGRFRGTEKPACWIATGTGIAPFISMTESGLHENKTLIHGARVREEFWFSDLFTSKMNDKYRRFATRDSGPGINTGRLTHWLDKQPGLQNDIKYYLCGSANMVVDVRDILVGKGISFENIVSEIYF